MRCVVIVLFGILLALPTFGALPSIDDLRLEISRNPDKIVPRLEMAKRLLQRGERGKAHGLIRDILIQYPNNEDAKSLMNSILLSDTPVLVSDEGQTKSTQYFLIPHLTKRQEFLKQIQLDAFSHRWQNLTGLQLSNKKITILLFDSEEAFLLASRGASRLVVSASPPTVGLDPRLNKDLMAEAIREGLVELWLKEYYPKAKLPPGLKAGLIGALSPLHSKVSHYFQIPIPTLLESSPQTPLRRDAASAFVLMLHELNPGAFSQWLSRWPTYENPMDELLKLYKFQNWKEVHGVFQDYLKKKG